MRILTRLSTLPLAPSLVRLPGLQPPAVQQLTNGSEVVSLHLPSAPVVCLELWCRAGSLFEGSAESGMAHFLEHMVFKGSRQLQPGEFDWRIEALGGSSNAATGFDDVHYQVLIPPEAAAVAAGLLVDLVLTPRLEASAFEMERQVVLEELAQSEDQPEEVALQHLLRRGCDGHPYGQAILGRREQLLSHSPDAMAAFHRRLYGSQSCSLTMCGALDPNSASTEELQRAVAESALSRLEPSGPRTTLPPLTIRPGRHRVSIPRLESTRLMMLWAFPPASDLPGVMGGDLLTSLLAEGRRSRLVDRLREQLRIVESIDLDLHVMECGSLALLEVIAEEEQLPAIHRAIGHELERLQQEPIPSADWQRTQRLVANAYRFSLESASGVASTLGNNHLWQRPLSLEAPLQALEQWTSESLQRHCLQQLSLDAACVLEAVPA